MSELSPKDIRDIAAYTGCNYSVEVFGQNPNKEGWPEEWWTKKGTGKGLLFRLCEWITDSHEPEQSMRNLKLYLRPIKKLTDTEYWKCAEIAGFPDVSNPTVDSWGAMFGNICMSTGKYHTGEGCDGDEIQIHNTGAVHSYLQSIGIYVPGTIRPELVLLIPTPTA